VYKQLYDVRLQYNTFLVRSTAAQRERQRLFGVRCYPVTDPGSRSSPATAESGGPHANPARTTTARPALQVG